MPSRSRFASRSSTSRAALTAVLGGAAGAAAAALVERRRHRRAEARLAREAQGRDAERQRLSAQIITAEQDERRRLSLFLHDGPLQSLSGIALMHDAAIKAIDEGRPGDALQVLESALAREREAIQTLRDLSFAMEPVVLRDHGFVAAVRALADQIRDGRGIAVELDVMAGELLGEKAQVALYQTIREALAQAEQRGPQRIAIGIAVLPDGSYETSVADDGVGERRRASVEAIGERAGMLNGRVSVETGERGGTIVRVRLPSYVAAV
jgi:two-component system NarL family sensor kinase